MTNREWLNSLSDEDFIKWLFEKDKFEKCENDIVYYEQPYPRLEHFKTAYTNTELALKEWLKDEKKI